MALMGNREFSALLGQLFLVGFQGSGPPLASWLLSAIRQQHLGGVILFDRDMNRQPQNIRSPEQLRELTAILQEHAEIPLFIAVDQEGGQVCRLKPACGFAAMPSAISMSSQGVEHTRRHAENMARQLAWCGINLNLAPVVDLDLNPDNPIIHRYQRSFGSDPDLVAELAQAFVEAHHGQNIGCCLKHFPGHGSAGEDSHLGFVDISECWQEIELYPYQWLIQRGYADGIMTAHLVHRALDPSGLPATLSAPMLFALLRKQLDFDGVIFSDDLQMGAIREGWDYAEAVQKAVLAGVDVLVTGNNLLPREDALTEGIRAIRALLDSGAIDADRIRRSLRRIEQLKNRITGKQPWTTTNSPTTC